MSCPQSVHALGVPLLRRDDFFLKVARVPFERLEPLAVRAAVLALVLRSPRKTPPANSP